MILRVALADCVVRDGTTVFEEELLTGVGAEVLGHPGDHNRLVRLWQYLNGHRIREWHEPTFFGSQSVLIDEYSVMYEDESQLWILDRPAVDAVVTIDKSRIIEMSASRDGAFLASPSTSWHRDDGSLGHLRNPNVIDRPDGSAIKTDESASWKPGVAFGITDDGPVTVTVSFISGTASIAPGSKPYPITPQPFTFDDQNDPNRVRVFVEATRDADGRVEHFGMRGRGLAAVLASVDFTPLVWFPDATYVSEHGFARSLRWECDTEGHDEAVLAVGGIDALGKVETLDLSKSQLSSEQLDQMLALPQLSAVTMPTQ